MTRKHAGFQRQRSRYPAVTQTMAAVDTRFTFAWHNRSTRSPDHGRIPGIHCRTPPRLVRPIAEPGEHGGWLEADYGGLGVA